MLVIALPILEIAFALSTSYRFGVVCFELMSLLWLCLCFFRLYSGFMMVAVGSKLNSSRQRLSCYTS
jgi:hypothetical protein